MFESEVNCVRQQWEQMTEQQKKLAVVLVVVIVLVLALIIWQLFPRSPSHTTPQQTATAPSGPSPTGGSQTGTPGGATGTGVGAPTPPAGLPGAAPAVTMGPPSAAPAPEVPAPPPPGKLEKPPRPGRPDPFADLRLTRPLPPITISLPPSPPPAVIVRAGSLGTESFSLQDLASGIPPLQAQQVDVRSYFALTRRAEEGGGELPGWRLVGTVLSENSVGAIIQMPDGRTRTVRPGDRVALGGEEYTVSRVEEQRVVLKDSEGRTHLVSRRIGIAPAPSSGGTMPYGPSGPSGY